MSSRLKSARIPLAILIAAASVPALTGCFGNPIEGLVRGGVEQAVEGATGGDVSLGGSLPEGWPQEVPVIDGEILVGGANTQDGANGWFVTIASNAPDPMAEARSKLEAEGFTEVEALAEAGGEVMVAMSNGEYDVFVAGSAEGILYTVVPATQ
jgi:hypothetical protein